MCFINKAWQYMAIFPWQKTCELHVFRTWALSITLKWPSGRSWTCGDPSHLQRRMLTAVRTAQDSGLGPHSWSLTSSLTDETMTTHHFLLILYTFHWKKLQWVATTETTTETRTAIRFKIFWQGYDVTLEDWKSKIHAALSSCRNPGVCPASWPGLLVNLTHPRNPAVNMKSLQKRSVY